MTQEELEFQIRLPALPELGPLVESFLLQILEIAGFDADARGRLVPRMLDLVLRIEEVVDEGSGDDRRPIDLLATIDPGRLMVAIREYGVPLDASTFAFEMASHEEIGWIQHGTDSELRFAIERPHAPIAVLESAEKREHQAETRSIDHDLEPSASSDDYRIRPYRAGDGISIARTIYETYGRDYPNPEMYDPSRIEQLNRCGRLSSVVCEAPCGTIAGAYALERPGLEAIGEAGQAVIDPRHRGHGLMKPMRREVERIGADLDLVGIYSQPTARHPISQRMNLRFGAVPTALCLGTTPGSAAFRAAVAGGTDGTMDSGRHSCFLYWHPLRSESPLRAHVPEPLARIVAALYQARGRDVTIETEPGSTSSDRRAACRTRYDAARGIAWIAVDHGVDPSMFDRIDAAIDALGEVPGIATIFVDLPIDDPGTIDVADRLLRSGLRPAGIGPGFQTAGCAHGPVEDVLRLQKSIAMVDLDGLVVEGELGEALRTLVLDPRWSP